ncbi:hypothetical protein Drorol1_Dr00014819 [Drosera rotundifolia]
MILRVFGFGVVVVDGGMAAAADNWNCQLESITLTSKPENLLLDSRGNLKVSDFGVSALPKQAESARIRDKYPDRIPVIVERAEKTDIPDIDKKKYVATELSNDMVVLVGDVKFYLHKVTEILAILLSIFFIATAWFLSSHLNTSDNSPAPSLPSATAAADLIPLLLPLKCDLRSLLVISLHRRNLPPVITGSDFVGETGIG